MLTQNGIHSNGSNGVHAKVLYPACPSDYEAASGIRHHAGGVTQAWLARPIPSIYTQPELD